LPCLALTAFGGAAAHAQTLTPDLFNPERGAFVAPKDLPLRRTAGLGGDATLDPSADPRARDRAAPSRIGQIPVYGVPAASGAAVAGYDSLNRKRQPPKYYPAQAKPKPPPGPGTPPPKPLPLNVAGQLRLSVPPSESAHKTPLPPAMADTVPGQPARRRLKLDNDPFGAVGDYMGSFLVKGAVELSAGYDTNPARIFKPIGSPLYMIAPELLVVSDWERHALVADLRGSFTGYTNELPKTIDGGVNPAPTNLNRPDFTGHVDGRLDVTDELRLTGETRLRVSTDNPGSPSVQAGLAAYPIYTTLGATAGFDQSFNRLEVAAGGTIDRTVYTNSRLTDGEVTSNDDRNFTQYGGIGRVSYDLKPGVKPFVEVEGDSRVHDLPVDRNGYERDSSGGYVKAGSSFELSRLLTGEISIGWAARTYADPRLEKLSGFLTTASLVWSATPLTTAKFFADTQIAETTLPGSSGVLVHTYNFEVDHDLRRWLTVIGKFTYGTYDYQGVGRNDQTYSIEGDLVYKLTRNFWIKGTLRHDILNSNAPQASSNATVVMLGVRLQN
jgi:hypothetical protein